jgi:23S rRNA pseudouridine955/2504/2580 synthase
LSAKPLLSAAAEGGELIEVAATEAGMRLDRWFKRHFPQVTHGRLQKWLRTGQVRIDARRAKSGTRLAAGQRLRVPPMSGVRELPAKAPASLKKANAAEADFLLNQVLHKDDHVIAINKPPGLAVQGGTKTHRHVDAMLDCLRFGSAERPRLVHRLDKDTSGVLLLARTAAAAAKLTSAFRSKEARKLYWAVVVGVPRPAEGTVDLSLSKRAGKQGERMAGGGGKKAVTFYRVVERAGRKAAWLALEPRTGRTHQLRVHALALKTPILGDGKYGGRAAFLAAEGVSRRLHLHARAIRIPHPAEGHLQVAAPLPEHMQATWRYFSFEAKGEDDPFAGFAVQKKVLRQIK